MTELRQERDNLENRTLTTYFQARDRTIWESQAMETATTAPSLEPVTAMAEPATIV